MMYESILMFINDYVYWRNKKKHALTRPKYGMFKNGRGKGQNTIPFGCRVWFITIFWADWGLESSCTLWNNVRVLYGFIGKW